MPTESRKQKLTRIVTTAQKLATRLEQGERIYLFKGYTINPRSRTDAIGRVLVSAGFPQREVFVDGVAALSRYLGVEAYRFPNSVYNAVRGVVNVNDDTTLSVQARRHAIARALTKLASVLKNVRFAKK